MSKNAVYTGKVKFFDTKKGYGFIINDHDSKETFVHIKQCNGRVPQADELVSFGAEETHKGVSALNVQVIGR